MHAYLDAFSGISGDMMVGALLDCGVPFADLAAAVASLGLEGCRLAAEVAERGPIRATRFRVEVAGRQPERTFATIREIVERGALAAPVRERALAAFRVLAEAEGAIHGVAPDHVHFHEVGGVDAIVDVVGAAFGVEALGITTLWVSPLPLGSGVVESLHGPLPVPAPATAELLRGYVVRPGDGAGELVTPTGAAILRGFDARPGPPPALTAARVGYGAGTRVLADRPNVLRLVLGEEASTTVAEEMLALECNIDDMSPELYQHAVGRLLAAGAADVSLVPVQMKKGRPGVLVQVLAPPVARDALAAILFAETTTLGVRFHAVGRLVLPRRTLTVETAYGAIAVKVAGPAERPTRVAPEYESCRAAAERHGVPLRTVYAAAERAAETALGI